MGVSGVEDVAGEHVAGTVPIPRRLPQPSQRQLVILLANLALVVLIAQQVLHEHKALLCCSFQVEEFQLRILLNDPALVIQHGEVVVAVGIVLGGTAYQVVYAEFLVFLGVDTFYGHCAEVGVPGGHTLLYRLKQEIMGYLQVLLKLFLGLFGLLFLRLNQIVFVEITPIGEHSLAVAIEPQDPHGFVDFIQLKRVIWRHLALVLVAVLQDNILLHQHLVVRCHLKLLLITTLTSLVLGHQDHVPGLVDVFGHVAAAGEDADAEFAEDGGGSLAHEFGGAVVEEVDFGFRCLCLLHLLLHNLLLCIHLLPLVLVH